MRCVAPGDSPHRSSEHQTLCPKGNQRCHPSPHPRDLRGHTQPHSSCPEDWDPEGTGEDRASEADPGFSTDLSKCRGLVPLLPGALPVTSQAAAAGKDHSPVPHKTLSCSSCWDFSTTKLLESGSCHQDSQPHSGT